MNFSFTGFLNVEIGPVVQSVFTSIKSDPNVLLHAFMNNSNPKEFLGSLNNDIIISSLLHMLGKWVKDVAIHGKDITLEVKDRILMMVNAISSFLNSIFGNSSSDKSSETTNNDGSWLAWLGNKLMKLGDRVNHLFKSVGVVSKKVKDRVVEMVTDLSKYVFSIFSFDSKVGGKGSD